MTSIQWDFIAQVAWGHAVVLEPHVKCVIRLASCSPCFYVRSAAVFFFRPPSPYLQHPSCNDCQNLANPPAEEDSSCLGRCCKAAMALQSQAPLVWWSQTLTGSARRSSLQADWIALAWLIVWKGLVLHGERKKRKKEEDASAEGEVEGGGSHHFTRLRDESCESRIA